MSVVGIAIFALLLGGLTWVMTVDLARAVRSGIAVFRVGRWSGSWENPISMLTSPFAFWSAVIWTGLWVIAFSIILSAIAIGALQRFL